MRTAGEEGLRLDEERICRCGLAMLFARSLPAILFSMTVVSLPGYHAEDGPQWSGPPRAGHAPANAPVPTSLPTEPKAIGRLKVGEGFTSPVVAGGKVVYFDNQEGNETLRAIDAADHPELGRAPVDDTFQDEQGPPGPRCTPVVDGDRVYAHSGKGELQCLRITNGPVVWHVNLLKEFGAAFLGEESKIPGAAEHGYTATPVIDGERLMDGVVAGSNQAGLIGVRSSADGRLDVRDGIKALGHLFCVKLLH